VCVNGVLQLLFDALAVAIPTTVIINSFHDMIMNPLYLPLLE
jgi:hypothetical protein